MIPKIIHYCWFGRNPKPKLAEKCIKSWKKYCPDYQIIEWNEDNYDISAAPLYVRQAYENKKWAFVTDYVRLDVVYKQGGIYFDTDVEVVKPFDDLLEYEAFFGFESIWHVATGLGFGAVKGNKLLAEMMDDYQDIPFVLEDGSFDTTACPERNSKILSKKGFVMDGTKQIMDGVAVFPVEWFCPLGFGKKKPRITKNTHSIHWYSSSWFTAEERKEAVKLNRKQNRKYRWNVTKHWVTHLPNKVANKLLGNERYERIKGKIKKK